MRALTHPQLRVVFFNLPVLQSINTWRLGVLILPPGFHPNTKQLELTNEYATLPTGMSPEICPNCGALVPENAFACPECGADEETGWNERATVQRLGLPDDEFDYDGYIDEEFGTEKANVLKVEGISWFWWAVAIAALYLIFGWLF